MAKSSAYSLIELVFSLIILSILMSSGISLYSRNQIYSNVKNTKSKLKIIEKSLKNFVLTNGYLPCPSVISELESNGNYGDSSNLYDQTTHTCLGSGSRKIINETGMLPVKQLNLSNDFAYDGWGRKFVYRIGTGLGSQSDFLEENINNFQGDLRIVDINGNNLTNIDDNYPGNYGASYVVISYGADGYSGFPKESSLQISQPQQNNIAYINTDHTNKIYVSSPPQKNYDDITVYKQKNDLINMNYNNSPIHIPSYSCKNAEIISEKGINNIVLQNLSNNASPDLGAIESQVLISAEAIKNLCNWQKQDNCDMSKVNLLQNQLAYWFQGDLPNIVLQQNSTILGVFFQNLPFYATNVPLVGISQITRDQPTQYFCSNLYYTNITAFNNNKPCIYINNSQYGISASLYGITSIDFTYFVVATYQKKNSNIFSHNLGSSGVSFNFSLQSNLFQIYLPNTGILLGLGGKTLDIAEGDQILITIRFSSDNSLNSFRIRGARGQIYESFANNYYNLNPPLNSNAQSSIILGDAYNNYNGYIGELMIYNAYLTDSQIIDVEDYLLKKWFSGECS